MSKPLIRREKIKAVLTHSGDGRQRIKVPDLERILDRGVAECVGEVIGLHLREGGAKQTHPQESVIVALSKDARRCNYLVESGLETGLLRAGVTVIRTGPMPAAAVALFTRSGRCNVGIMITGGDQSHEHTGLRLFNAKGAELRNGARTEVLTNGTELLNRNKKSSSPGTVRRLEGAHERYIEALRRTVEGRDFSGYRVVVDCANGSAYHVVSALQELGAELVKLGCEPNGFNINQLCGVEHPDILRAKVREVRADLGISLDADGDRVILCTDDYQTVHGEQILATIAHAWQRQGKLAPGMSVLTTTDASKEFELCVESVGLRLERVGPSRYEVGEQLQARKLPLGGSVSGSVIMPQYTLVGDGLMTALQILSIMRGEGKRARDLFAECAWETVPKVAA